MHARNYVGKEIRESADLRLGSWRSLLLDLQCAVAKYNDQSSTAGCCEATYLEHDESPVDSSRPAGKRKINQSIRGAGI